MDFKAYGNGKRYYSFSQYLIDTFGEKVFKISLDAGFSCPNRDGTISTGGCTFCSEMGSGDFVQDSLEPLAVQFEKYKVKQHKKWAHGKYIAYFQAYTNTHAPVSILKERFEPLLREKNVVGISIATRPDALAEDVLDYLGQLNELTFLWVELGLQTIHDKTAEIFNRGYSYSTYLRAIENLRRRNINVCTHIINGLPDETFDMMRDTAKKIAKSDVQGIKIHSLHLMENTPMVKLYNGGGLTFLEQEEYVNLVCDQLEILSPHMIIHRLTGDGAHARLIGPKWSANKWKTLNAIDKTLLERGSYQGIYY